MTVSPGQQVILAINGLSLNFGGIRSLHEVSFSVQEGEILSIIGPNGAGKTCLLNCISGHYKADRGSILFAGHDLAKMKPYRIARLGIARTFQNPSLYPQLTALENLMVARAIRSKISTAEALLYFGRGRREEIASRQAVEAIIRQCQIEDLRSRPAMMMSYGQRKQVEIARALLMEPKLILLDEPMSGLDDMMKEIVTEQILSMQRNGITIILIEHDIEVVMGISRSVVVLDHGQKIAEGTPAEVSGNPDVIEAYLGALPETVRHGDAGGRS